MRSIESARGVLTITSVNTIAMNEEIINVDEGLFLNDNGFLERMTKIINVCDKIPNVNQITWKAVACSGV